MLKILRALLKKKSAALSKGNSQIIKPPAAAVEEQRMSTKHVFCECLTRLSRNMNVAHPPRGFHRMNAPYGQLLLEKIVGINDKNRQVSSDTRSSGNKQM
ncbi:hypothetical protein C8N30_0862 [Sulfitobacter guttiformis]|uniref:Uncharacterized protein n=1 Tax=Sulfitobacter guttiformis TaxID=74349 RepID=A0A420DPR0_9RHOB|nr:hypothetical protein C8N30_0862 [Sulfitobacter guttiformis]